MRRLAPALAAPLAALALAGCSFFGTRGPRVSPQSPGFDAARTAQAVAQAPAGGTVYLSERLRAARLQPLRLGQGHLVYLDPAQPSALGYVAGKYPLRAQELLVVAVPARATGTALGAWTEVAHVTAGLGRHYVFPERTVLFAALAGDPVEALGRFFDGRDWPADAIAGVMMMGLPPSEDARLDVLLRRVGVPRLTAPSRPDAFALAQDAFLAMRPAVFATGAPSDSLLTPDSLAALRSDTVYRTVPQPRNGWGIRKY